MAQSQHLSLFRAYVDRYPEKPRNICQKEANATWSDAKQLFVKDKIEFENFISKKIEELKRGTTKKKVTTLFNFFTKQVIF